MGRRPIYQIKAGVILCTIQQELCRSNKGLNLDIKTFVDDLDFLGESNGEITH